MIMGLSSYNVLSFGYFMMTNMNAVRCISHFSFFTTEFRVDRAKDLWPLSIFSGWQVFDLLFHGPELLGSASHL